MRLNHLFFVDDSHFFCKAKVPEWLNIQDILSTYELASGQKLNREKTSIFFQQKYQGRNKAASTPSGGAELNNPI